MLNAPCAADEKSRADEQRERERHLRADEQRAQTIARRARAASPLAQRLLQLRTRRAQRRREPEDEAAHDAEDKREAEHAPIDRRLIEPRNVFGAHSAQQPQQTNATASPATAPVSDSIETFGEQLPDSRPRPAPSAARIASSLARVVARASSRLATLPHAMSSTKPTAPSRMNSSAR